MMSLVGSTPTRFRQISKPVAASSSSRAILSSSPFALPDQFADIRRRTYLDASALQLHSRRLGNKLDSVIQIARFEYLNPA